MGVLLVQWGPFYGGPVSTVGQYYGVLLVQWGPYYGGPVSTVGSVLWGSDGVCNRSLYCKSLQLRGGGVSL